MELIDDYLKYFRFRKKFNIYKYGDYYIYYINNYNNPLGINDYLGIKINTYINLVKKYNMLIVNNSDIYFKTKKEMELFIKDLYIYKINEKQIN